MKRKRVSLLPKNQDPGTLHKSVRTGEESRPKRAPTFPEQLKIDSKEARRLLQEYFGQDSLPTDELDISKPYAVSARLLREYVTLDAKHLEDIQKLIKTVDAYASDVSRRRPLNVIMRAEPGSGKSHFVKCLARRLRQHQATAVDFNMASLQNVEDLVIPLDAVRNQKVLDRLPMLFLDEFDTNPEKFAMLLPLLWDGEFHVAHKDLKLGKLVVILAGSTDRIEEAMLRGKMMQNAATPADGKLADLLSRINGGELEIPSLELVDVGKERDRRVDKICLTIALIQQRFGYHHSIRIPWSFLRFIYETKFRYGVRSIAHLVDLLKPPSQSRSYAIWGPIEEPAAEIQVEGLPLGTVQALKESSLAYHIVAEDGPAAVIELWSKASKSESFVLVDEGYARFR